MQKNCKFSFQDQVDDSLISYIANSGRFQKTQGKIDMDNNAILNKIEIEYDYHFASTPTNDRTKYSGYININLKHSINDSLNKSEQLKTSTPFMVSFNDKKSTIIDLLERTKPKIASFLYSSFPIYVDADSIIESNKKGEAKIIRLKLPNDQNVYENMKLILVYNGEPVYNHRISIKTVDYEKNTAYANVLEGGMDIAAGFKNKNSIKAYGILKEE